jgi:hypothetical protein
VTIAFAWEGSANPIAGSGTTVIPTFPAAGVEAGHLAVLLVSNKIESDAPVTPSGWSAPTNNTGTGGTGSAGADAGPLRLTVLYKVCDGTEDGTTVTVSFSPTAHEGAQAQIIGYSKTLATWDVAGCGAGSVSTGATAWSQAVAVDPGVAGGDWLITARSATTDAGAWTNPPPATVITGCTMGTMTERGNSGTTNGNDLESQYADEPVSSGSSSSVATVKGTESSSTTGVVFAVRIREVAAAGGLPPRSRHAKQAARGTRSRRATYGR